MQPENKLNKEKVLKYDHCLYFPVDEIPCPKEAMSGTVWCPDHLIMIKQRIKK